MLKNYLLLAMRNFARNKAVSTIHIAGFGLGMAAFLFSVETVHFEYSFDDFHSKRNRIYQLTTVFPSRSHTRVDPAIASRIEESIPEVQYAARYIAQKLEEAYCVVTYFGQDGSRKSFNEPNTRYVDKDFLRIFDFSVLKGNKDRALEDDNAMVITKSIAIKYFGTVDAVNQVLEVTTGGTESNKTRFRYRVAAVIEDPPANSSLYFDILLPFGAFENNYKVVVKDIWLWGGSFFTFIQTREEIGDVDFLKAKINKLFPEEIKKNIKTAEGSFEYGLVPLDEVHFNKDGNWGPSFPVLLANETLVIAVGIIGMSVLLIAAVNYINLTTAKTIRRAKEIGIRKVSGANRAQLFTQFMIDSAVANTLGLLLALTILQICRPMIILWLGVGNAAATPMQNSPIMLLALVVVSTLISGTIPAIMYGNVRPATALKGQIARTTHGAILRKSLVTFQFAVSVILITFTYVIIMQLDHMRSKDLGFQVERRIAIAAVGTEDFDFTKFRKFKERITRNPAIISATATIELPGFPRLNAQSVVNPLTGNEIYLNMGQVENDFARTLGIRVIAGREFTDDLMADEIVAMLNETAAIKLGYSSPHEAVGATLMYEFQNRNMPLKVIGVFADHNLQSPEQPVNGMVYFFANTAHPYPKYSHYLIHVANTDARTIQFLKNEWNNIFVNAPFEYTFLDQEFEKVFEKDNKTRSVAVMFTVFAIFIACIGLGGLVAYSVSQRVKEIGIRKTLGASVQRILYLLSHDYIRLILIAAILATPIAWYVITEYLENFSYRIDISAWIFLIPFGSLLIVAILAVSVQTLKAATANPVESLRHE